MTTSRKIQPLRQSKEDVAVDIDPQVDRPRPTLRSQIITSVKLVAITGGAVFLLWFLDQLLAG